MVTDGPGPRHRNRGVAGGEHEPRTVNVSDRNRSILSHDRELARPDALMQNRGADDVRYLVRGGEPDGPERLRIGGIDVREVIRSSIPRRARTVPLRRHELLHTSDRLRTLGYMDAADSAGEVGPDHEIGV